VVKQSVKMILQANCVAGVGGFVVNDREELLVIQEKFHPLMARAHWKLPGGCADRGRWRVMLCDMCFAWCVMLSIAVFVV